MRTLRCELCLLFWLLACESPPDPMPEIKPQASVEAAPEPGPGPVQRAPAAAAAAAAATAASDSGHPPEESGTRRFWVDPDHDLVRAARRLQGVRTREADWIRQLAEQPHAVWFTPSTQDPRRAGQKLAHALAGSQSHAVAVIKALAQRDCRRHLSSGFSPDAYRLWIQNLVQGLGEAPIYWILEPEALLLTGCLPQEERTALLNLLAETVLILKKNSKALVYIDGGYPGWLTADEAVNRLMKAGISNADGFALNVGLYHATMDCIHYGRTISQKLGGKGFVIDTSRNGRVVSSQDSWCNPKNRALGEWPRAPTGMDGVDAFLWLKTPGESDGPCNGGAAVGVWSESQAIELMRNLPQPQD